MFWAETNWATAPLESYLTGAAVTRFVPFARGSFSGLWPSGGPGGGQDSISIARAMANVMTGLGVPPDIITIEEQSKSTRENALFTARMIGGWAGSKVLMSSDIHMRRAHAAFARAGVDTIPVPIPDIGKRWNSWVDRWDCIWEVGAGTVNRWILRGAGLDLNSLICFRC